MVRKKYEQSASDFSGGLDLTSGNENLKSNQLTIAENVRYSRQGGVFTRSGHEEVVDVASSAKIDSGASMDEYGVSFWKSGTKIYQGIKSDIDNGNAYTIGTTRTAAAGDFLYPYRGNVYATNKTDNFIRIAVSTLQTAITAGVSTTVSVKTGDGSKFTNGAVTIYIEGDAISATGTSTDDITVTAGTIAADHAVGTIVTEVTVPSGAPKGVAISDLEGSLLVIKERTIFYSAPATEDNPEYAYDFSNNGAGSQALPDMGTAINKVMGGIIIGTKSGMEFAYGFNLDTNGLETRPLSDRHPVPNAFCFTQGDKYLYVFTGKRILPIQSNRDGVQIIEDPFNAKNNMDYPIRADLADADETQTLAFSHFDPTRSEASFSVFKDLLSKEYVYSEDLGVWSIDTGKSFSCKLNLGGEVYAGSDTDDKLYRDNTLTTDATIPIFHRILTRVFTTKDELVTSDYQEFPFKGLLSGNGFFTFRVYIDGELTDEREISATTLQDSGLMDVTSGVPIGGGVIGNETIGFGDSGQDAFTFTYPYDILITGESIQFEFEVFDEGTSFELRGARLGAEHSDTLELPHT